MATEHVVSKTNTLEIKLRTVIDKRDANLRAVARRDVISRTKIEEKRRKMRSAIKKREDGIKNLMRGCKNKRVRLEKKHMTRAIKDIAAILSKTDDDTTKTRNALRNMDISVRGEYGRANPIVERLESLSKLGLVYRIYQAPRVAEYQITDMGKMVVDAIFNHRSGKK